MVSWDGTQHIQLTSTLENESRPRWSPDGRFLSFVSARQGTKNPQVWLLNRLGGEAVRLTDVKGAVSDYAWSPDSARLVLVVEDPDPADPPDEKEAAREDPPRHPGRSSSTATTSRRTSTATFAANARTSTSST